MKEKENHFGIGTLLSLILHLAVISLLALGVDMPRNFPSESSVEISLANYREVVEEPQKKKLPANPKANKTKSKKPEKKIQPKKKKPPAPKKVKQQPALPTKKQKKSPKEAKTDTVKTPEPKEIKTDPAETPEPKEAKTDPAETPEPKEIKTDPVETPEVSQNISEETEETSKRSESEKKHVLREIRKESILETLKKPTEAKSQPETSSEKSDVVSSKPHVTSEKTKKGVISLVLDVYYKNISKRIEKTLILPPDVGPKSLLSATVSFYMKTTGEVYDAKIERSSGNQRFDSYCVRAVNISSPLPIPPVELRDRIKTEPFIIPCKSSD